MVELTVGAVSGIIAAVVHLVQICGPMILAVVLVALVPERHSALTWSVLGRTIHSTHWPTILRSDTAASAGIHRRVQIISWLTPTLLVLLAIAAIVTPLGLYDTLAPSGSTVPVDFHYAKDKSAFGMGTPQRSSLQFSRKCGFWTTAVCPGSKTQIETYSDSKQFKMDYEEDTSVPQDLVTLFDSGREDAGSTISSVWDIQWRSYTSRSYKNADNGSAILTGIYRPLGSLVLEDAVRPVEGLIVDMERGGIGFRNHTIPVTPGNGVTWTEDILFVQPESSCVNSNLSLDFTISEDTRDYSMALIDHGGFANLPRTWPDMNHRAMQDSLDLQSHAYTAVYLNNLWTMFYLNVTNPREDWRGAKFDYMESHRGKAFPIYIPGWSNQLGISFDSLGSYLASFRYHLSLSRHNASYANPFDVQPENLTTAGTRCQGALNGDLADIGSVAVSCGMMIGVAKRTDGGSSLLNNEPGSNWTLPIFGCATAVKAVIKTVSFTLNGTSSDLRSLEITNVQDKIYKADDELPLWGVEHSNTMLLRDIKPLWGIVSPQFENNRNASLSTVRKESLWLPGYVDLSNLRFVFVDSIAGTVFHTLALESVYNNVGSLKGEYKQLVWDDMPFDFTGRTSMALRQRWQDLAQNSTGAAKIPNLIWTDVAANSVVGTRSWLGSQRPPGFAIGKQEEQQRSQNAGGEDIVRVPVIPTKRHIKYDLRYAVPAILVLALLVPIILAAISLVALRLVGISKLRRYLNHTSVGRSLAAHIYPEDSNMQARTRVWRRQVGFQEIDLSSSFPKPYPKLLDDEPGTPTPGPAALPPRAVGDRSDDIHLVTRSQTAAAGDTRRERIAQQSTIRRRNSCST